MLQPNIFFEKSKKLFDFIQKITKISSKMVKNREIIKLFDFLKIFNRRCGQTSIDYSQNIQRIAIFQFQR